MKHRNNTIDEARDEESELGFKNNGVRDEARDEEKSFWFGQLGIRIIIIIIFSGLGFLLMPNNQSN